MFSTFDVNGAAIEASDFDREIPTSAAFSAFQSLAPSPHIAIISLVSTCSSWTNDAFSKGDILAYTLQVLKIQLSTSFGGYPLMAMFLFLRSIIF